MCWTGQAIVLSEDLEFVAQQLNLPLIQDTSPLDPIVRTDEFSFDHVLLWIPDQQVFSLILTGGVW